MGLIGRDGSCPAPFLTNNTVSENNIILTAYFCTYPNPQRNVYWDANDISLINPLYNSVKELGLKMIVFHDNLNEEFIKQYTTENIKFKVYQPKGNILTQRFWCYLDYLLVNKYDKVLCIDCGDTDMYKDPFELIDDDKVLIGSEEGLIGQTVFMRNWFRRAYGRTLFADKQRLNCGILGGKYSVMINLLTLFKEETAHMNDNVDMAVFNKLLHGGIKYKTGHPVHTEFWEEEGPESGCYIKHK